jgi:hypothetical protein
MALNHLYKNENFEQGSYKIRAKLTRIAHTVLSLINS